jgi:hypothetical protein
MGVPQPQAGLHYPRSTGELRSWFGTDADCLDYLGWLRWPQGFVCPRCGHRGGWATADGRYKCETCGGRASVTAGTLFDRRRTPLTVWFTDPAAAGSSSTACSSSPSRTIPCAMPTWSSTRSRRRHHPRRPGEEGTLRAWSARERLGHGEHPDPGLVRSDEYPQMPNIGCGIRA